MEVDERRSGPCIFFYSGFVMGNSFLGTHLLKRVYSPAEKSTSQFFKLIELTVSLRTQEYS